MKRSLRTQMLIQYAALVIICMVVIPTVISRLLDWQFRNFAEARLNDDRQEVVLLVKGLYERNNSWEALRAGGLISDFMRWPVVGITVYDSDGAVVRGLSRGMRPFKGKRPHAMMHEMPNAGCRVVDEPIIVDGVKVGKVSFSC
ncbi:MAG: hypothetical protein RR214_01555, partial [Synergistaceae bacterium]